MHRPIPADREHMCGLELADSANGALRSGGGEREEQVTQRFAVDLPVDSFQLKNRFQL